jgi:predicted nucleotide-binding protein
MAITELERKRRRWRILYTVYTTTADELTPRTSVKDFADSQAIPLDAVKVIAVELRDAGLVAIRGVPPSDTFRLSITTQGKSVVERASFDADPDSLLVPADTTPVQHHAELVLRALAEYTPTDADEPGYHELDEIDLQGLTNLRTRHLNDAVDRLDRDGYLDGQRYLVGHALNWKGQLNHQGREEYQRLRMVATSQQTCVSDCAQVAQAEIRKLIQDLDSIVENAVDENIPTGREQLRRWKQRAVQVLRARVSSAEAKRLSEISTFGISLMGYTDRKGRWHSQQVDDEAGLYRGFLKALLLEIERYGEAALAQPTPERSARAEKQYTFRRDTMPNKKTPDRLPPPDLTQPLEQAMRHMQEQIAKGQALRDTPITSEAGLDQVREAQSRWHKLNVELLTRMASNTALADEFDKSRWWSAAGMFGGAPPLSERATEFTTDMNHRLNSLESILERLPHMMPNQITATPASPTTNVIHRSSDKPVIFIGHGGNRQWEQLELFLRRDKRYDVESYESSPRAGYATVEVLQEMLDKTNMALLVHTAEDEVADGPMRARENVVHEAGLFQGRHGFKRAIVLLEEGCNEYSNIRGLTQIRFPKGDIQRAFAEVLQTIQREFP